MIEVEYDGAYPCSCMGTLIIKENGIEIYNKQYCCSSSGSVWFSDDWDANVEDGELTWNDAEDYSEEIQEALNLLRSGTGTFDDVRTAKIEIMQIDIDTPKVIDFSWCE